MPHVVGIDLGTTNSLVAYIRGDRPEIIPNDQGRRLTPSIVGLDRSDQLHVGETAKNQLVAMPERTVAEVKRLMGSAEKVRLAGRQYSPQEISALILKQLKGDAEKFLGGNVEEAVITVPAYFTDAQRQATKDAGELAGFRVERILNEPTAAALAYGLDHLDKEQFILVYDLGGGTFDVSVLEMFDGVLDVKASAGNNHLGGGDFDRTIVDWLAKEFERTHGVDLKKDIKAVVRLKAAAEQAKIELSTVTATQIMLPFIAVRGADPLSLELELTRGKCEQLLGAMLRSTLEPVEMALKDAKLDRKAIAEIVLVGGSSRIPLVRNLISEYFGKEPKGGVHPDEAIALGAAVQAGLKSGAIPASSGIMITDVCPYTLGVEVMGAGGITGLFSAILPRNSTIPVSRTETYSTTVDGQRRVDIKVYQGEARMVKNNTFLDEYAVDGVPAGPAGSEKVGITFTYDANGILNVTTRIVSTGREAKLQIAKSAQRMNEGERAKATARLEKEWKRSAPPTAASAPERVRADESASANPTGAPATVSAGLPVAASPKTPTGGLDPGVRALIDAAQRKLADLDPERRQKIEELIGKLKSAAVRQDPAEISRFDSELTNVLFDLD